MPRMSKLAEILSPSPGGRRAHRPISFGKGRRLYSSFQKRSFCVFRLFCVFLRKELFFLVHSAINFRSPPSLLYLPFSLPPPSYLAICMEREVSPHLSYTVSLLFLPRRLFFCTRQKKPTKPLPSSSAPSARGEGNQQPPLSPFGGTPKTPFSFTVLFLWRQE